MKRVLLTLAIFASGCPTRPCPTTPFTQAQTALDAYRNMRQPARVIRAEARVDRRDAEGRIRGTVRMFIEQPDHVRFDAMTQMGPAAVLTSDGTRFALMDMRENRFFVGPTCPANIERLLGVRLGAGDVTRMLLGDTPRIDATQEEMHCADGTYFITLRAADGTRQEIELMVRDEDLRAAPEDQRLRLRRSEVIAPGGTTVWRVTYGDYRFIADPDDTQTPHRGVVLPYSVRFEEPLHGVDTLVRFVSLDLNVAPPPGVFEQTPHEGLAIEPVTCD